MFPLTAPKQLTLLIRVGRLRLASLASLMLLRSVLGSHDFAQGPRVSI